MDIFIQNVPKNVNHVEFRIFMRDKLRSFDILAFDVVKKQGFDFAILTIANSVNARNFLQRYGPRGHQFLLFRSIRLNCKASNRRGQPEPLKVIALLQKEEELRSRQFGSASSSKTPGSSQPVFRFLTLMTGVWNYDYQGKLIFDQKFKDLRAGSITFGRTTLVIYLESTKHAPGSWHGRIDIPYAILEHTMPSLENGQHGSITLTLKSPPKIYRIMDTDGLHLYTGEEPAVALNALEMAMARLKVSDQSRRTAQLERLCELQMSHDKASALCMVYKVILPKLDLVYQAWAFLKDFTVPEIHCWKAMVPCESIQSIEHDLANLEASLDDSQIEFTVQFQILALVLEGTVTPTKMRGLVSYISSASKKHGSRLTSIALKYLGRQIPTPGPHVSANAFDVHTLITLFDISLVNAEKAESVYHDLNGQDKQREHLALTHKATITPTGMILRGPDWSVSNRILRKHSRYTGHFIRISFADEDGLSVFHDSKASQSQVYARFRKVLREGILIAGRRFEFLGFSHASLRCHETWFMAPFLKGSTMVHAKDVIKDLGDFTNIHCSAKCAARIGQAFSDTIFAVRIPDTAFVREAVPDIRRNGRTFSDGCGSMSLELFQQVWRVLPPERRQKRPTVLQIRYRGAKGVLSLDTSLIGEQLNIRKSMTKYTAAAGWKDLELCGAAYRPLTMFLNHQFIQILEDLGVPLPNFVEVQNEACGVLEKIIKHPLNAASFLEYSHTGVQAKVPKLFELMHYVGLSFQTDRFLTEIVEVAAMNSLRDLKYRARIPIEKGYMLYGIMDETNTLKEGEVYIVTQDQTDSGREESNVLLRNRVVVMRAPALHPGDVQLVTAVEVPNGSPLRSLHNCIVFSQQGTRDLPSQLSGGDLGGDKFHIIYDQRLIPDFTVPPADYATITPHNLGRSVEINDIVDFFIDFMQMDKLGQISNMHKIRADKSPDGTRDDDCKTLAKLASDAVDFSKSGIPADFTKVPRGHDYIRPDFMAPSHNFVINEIGAAELEELNTDDIEDPDRINVLDPDQSRFRYYRSNKALGHLYRDIDEKKFFDRMKGDFVAMRHTWGGESLVQKLEPYIDRETSFIQWEHHTTFAEELREYYELNMIEIMDTLRPRRGKPLTELEVFSGNILGKKERASTRYTREANQEVRERFDRDVSAIVRDIVRGDEDSKGIDNTEALPRAIACFKVSLQTEGWQNNVTLKSWKYVAAAVCLEQLWKFQGGSLRPL